MLSAAGRIGRDRLRLSRAQTAMLSALVAEHMRLHLLATAPDLTDRAVRRFFRDLGAKAGFKTLPDPRNLGHRHIQAMVDVWRSEHLAPATIRRKLAALSALFNHLCECNAVLFNPTRGVKRPPADANEGKTPAIGDGQVTFSLSAILRDLGTEPAALKGAARLSPDRRSAELRELIALFRRRHADVFAHIAPTEAGFVGYGNRRLLSVLTKKPVMAGPDEVEGAGARAMAELRERSRQ